MSEAFYRARAAQFGQQRDLAAARWSQVANLRLGAAVLALAAAGLGWSGHVAALFWIAGALAVVFLGLVLYHNRLASRRDRLAALYEQNREGLLRLQRDWSNLPLRQPAQARPFDPTALDLDLLGPASLQHLLNTARSPAGLTTLQGWLLTPAAPATVARRQSAVAELAPLVDLRDELAYLAGRAGEAQAPYERFIVWAESEPWLLKQPVMRWLCWLSPALLIIGALAQVIGVTPLPLWAPFFLLNMLLTAFFGARTMETLTQLYDRADLLSAYAALFGLGAGAALEAEELRRLQAELGKDTQRADRQLGRLALIAAAAELSRSLLYPALQFGLLWGFQVVALAEGWRRTTGRRVGPWLAVLGEFEALCALATLRHDHPAWSFPELHERHGSRIEGTALGHPLLPPAQCVPNDVVLGPAGSFLLVTGSNMSGKSTLLRAIGVNIALAQAGGPICGSSLRLPPVVLATSMRVQDSLAQGVSYFMAELRRLKAIVDLAEATHERGDALVCFLLDEILHGTNSAERLVAAARVIEHLVGLGAIGAVSTHDLALAADPSLVAAAQLAHFSETFVEGPSGPEMRFDYRLRPGLATRTNALRLMALVGLPTAEVPAQHQGD